MVSIASQIALVSLFTVGVALAVLLYWTDRVRRREAVYRWSSDNNFRLLSFRQPLLTEASEFPFSLSKSQHVFRIAVETTDGAQKEGWLRVGSAWLGLSSNTADVAWDTTDK